MVLIAEDNSDDCLIAMRAWEESRLGFDVRFVHDGRELMDYVYRRRKWHGSLDLPLPQLILLDLNMPRKDGRRVLEDLQGHPEWSQIPIVILSGSRHPRDIQQSEMLGAYDFITKPETFDEYQRMITQLGQAVLEKNKRQFA
ncbi:MAG: response regulator [Nitrospirota bacterium]|nr:response regulator [Nitrospirota bacterium]